jgi:hypothetical protein
VKRSRKIEYAFQTLKSPKRGHTFWGLVTTLIVSYLMLFYFHKEWLHSPNDYLLNGNGQGLGNYVSALWHIQKDSTYVHYDGMNYPYGEHVLFTDNQPVFTTFAQWWSHNVADIRPKAVGIINSFQFFSLLLGVAILFLLLRKLHLPVWYAGPISLGMILLSPQYVYFDARFSLSHCWVFPWILFLLCRYEERASRRYQSISIGFGMFVVAQLNPTYFGIAAFFLLLYTGYHFLYDFSWRNIWRRISHLVVMLVLPFVCLNVWLHWADFVLDRPSLALAHESNPGNFQGLLPQAKVVKMSEMAAPIRTYLGFSALLFCLWLLGIWSKKYAFRIANIFLTEEKKFIYPRLFPKNWNEAASHRVHRRYLYGILLSALLLLLFSLYFPPGQGHASRMPPQLGSAFNIRGLGQFAWVFFYVVNIILFYVLWNTSMRINDLGEKRRKIFKGLLLFVPLILLYGDAFRHQIAERPKVLPNDGLKVPVPNDHAHWYNMAPLQTCQAILPLPYYHSGSESFVLPGDSLTVRQAEVISLMKGIPNMAVQLNRSSISQSLKSIQLLLEPCEIPKILDDLPNAAPIALFMREDCSKQYPHLFAAAKAIYSGPEMLVFKMSPDSLTAQLKKKFANVNLEAPSSPTRAPEVFQVDFEEHVAKRHVFQGKGAFEGLMSAENVLFSGQIPQGEFLLSFWVYAAEDACLTQGMSIILDGKKTYASVLNQHLKSIVGGWALIEMPLSITNPLTELQVILQKKGVDLPFNADELMIRPLGKDQYQRQGNWVMKNNYWYKT